MVEASFLASFLGGLLSLLSPCSALLLPAFFAYAFQSRGVLVGRTAVFYLGLCATLVPLGMGISAVSSLVYGHRSTLITVSGLVIIALGVIQALEAGSRSGPSNACGGGISGSSLLATFSLGAVYGFAGSARDPSSARYSPSPRPRARPCGAPASSPRTPPAWPPLFVMALLWDRLDLGRRRWLRGREISLGSLRLHTTNLLSGLMFVAIGVLFIVSEGTSGLEALYASGGATDLAFSVERWAGSFGEGTLLSIMFAGLGLLFAGLLVYRLARRRKKKSVGRGG